MVNEKERLLKAEHDAWLANAEAAKNTANIDFIAMMTGVDIDDEEIIEEDSEDGAF